MSLRLLAGCDPGQIRVALLQGEQLLDYALWRPGAPDGVDDLHRGRIDGVMPALGGAFVFLAGAGSGFLPAKEPELAAMGAGDPVLVQVSRSAQGGKGPRLRMIDSAAAADHPLRGPPALLQRGADPLSRLAADHPAAVIEADDPALAAELVPHLRPRIILRAVAILPAVDGRIAALEEPELVLPNGMRASIHPTPALVAIDLDGGATTANRQDKQRAQFQANRAALVPLLHELRLRNLSGAILLDLAGLPSRKRQALRPDIERALARDPLTPRLLGFTALGLAEIVRPRVHPPLHELLHGPHAAALAALRHAARMVDRPPHRLPRLVMGLAAATALEKDGFARGALARRAGQPISFRVDPSMPPLSWTFDHD